MGDAMRRVIALVLMSACLAGCAPHVTVVSDPSDFERANRDLKGRSVKAVFHEGKSVEGQLVSVRVDSSTFRDRDSGSLRSFATQSIKAIGTRTPGSSSIKGLVFGAAIGALPALASSSNPMSGAALLLGASLGGAIGALGGVFWGWHVYKIDLLTDSPGGEKADEHMQPVGWPVTPDPCPPGAPE
jgi:hypothetical protein